METNAAIRYATGCASSIPRIPQKCGRTRQRGMNIAPLCIHDSISAGMLCPMLWNSIDPTTETGRNSRNTHIIRSASLPIAITFSSGRNSAITCGASTKQTADIQPMNTVPKPSVNNAPAFTLEYLFAP